MRLLPRIERRLLAAALLLAACTAPAWAFGVDELMALLARQQKGEARFTEQRYVRGVDGPLQSAGVLSFEAPDKLVRRTLSPRPDSMSVEGNQLVMQRGGRTRTTTLDSMPEVMGMIEAMRGTLMGNAPQLQRYFRTKLSGDEKAWALDLDPIDPALAAQVRSLRISGRGGEVLGVEMEFIGGDRSVMTIVPGRGTP
ncbi:outer membrane lipoprotein carrier protein LolA [Xenophilus azovorans]|uniref:outer membrane lipoprotein carrier protein LolA n=1 Tax=Xenophilus azovorans TaxID=151755 RepID=UPI000AAB7E34|nr:outer membrane lipoprotein carrier protein LolA [Xenophilus azovorans]